MRVVVFGAGAVGGHLAARLAAHGPAAGIEVAAVARGAQLEAMNQRGITLWIGGERTSAPIHATDQPETLGHQDVVLVTMKSSVLPGVAQQLRTLIGPETTVIFVRPSPIGSSVIVSTDSPGTGSNSNVWTIRCGGSTSR